MAELQHHFYDAVSATKFADRYYALCSKYPMRDDAPINLPTKELRKILSRIGRDESEWNSDARAFEHFENRENVEVSIGFRIHGRTTIDFDFCANTQNGQRCGGSFAGIAHDSMNTAGHTTPDPKYPRPEFHTHEEVRDILVESFAIGDFLIESAQQVMK